MPEFSQQHRSPYGSGFYIQDLGTANFYGLEFVDTFEDQIIPNQNLVTRPSVLIEGSTILLDYSDSADSIDKNFIDTLFRSMNSSGGTFSSGFTISGAIYNDPIRNYSADLSASCTLNNYDNYKILGTFSSIGSTIETNFYHSKFFETVPQITSITGLTTGITLNSLINFPTSNDTSFVSGNYQTGDYIDVDTSLNSARLTISGITVDALSRELVSFTPSVLIIPEDLKGTKTTIGHLRKTSNTTNGPVGIESQKTITHRVSTKLVDGAASLTIDSEIGKSLVLTRGIMYLFIVDNTSSINFQFLDSIKSAVYSEIGIYSVLDNTLNKKYVYFIPNNLTPNQLYYNSSTISGEGGIQITGSYSYSYNTSFNGSLAGSTVSASTPTGYAFGSIGY